MKKENQTENTDQLESTALLAMRSDKKHQKRLEPRGMETALDELSKRGYACLHNENSIRFAHNGHSISYYPYSGWATGKSIKDGRGLKNLLKQLNS